MKFIKEKTTGRVATGAGAVFLFVYDELF